MAEAAPASTPPASTPPASVPEAALAAPPRRRRRRWLRPLLMASLPAALLLAGGWYWVVGARWVATENAYVTQDKIVISTEVGGRIAEVLVAENKVVNAGDLLFRLNPDSYRIALAKAESAVAAARLQVGQLRTALKAADLKVAEAKETLAFQQKQMERQTRLLKSGSTTESQFDQTRHELAQAEQAAAEADQAVRNAVTALDGDPAIPTDRHPLVRQALAEAESAGLDLQRTEVRAPMAGLVAQVANLQVGQVVSPGSAVMAVVGNGATWIEANFKETDLEHLRAGQRAELEFDAYPGTTVAAHVESIGAGTGATFSLLPAQNATGNWVKVVQRVPVRLVLDQPPPMPLITGLSVAVAVDTGFVRPLPAPVGNVLAAVGVAPGYAREAGL